MKSPISIPTPWQAIVGQMINDAVAKKVSTAAQVVNELRVYPNPSSDRIKIEMKRDSDYEIFLYASDGKLISEQILSGDGMKLSVSDLHEGFYLVKVHDLEDDLWYEETVQVVRK